MAIPSHPYNKGQTIGKQITILNPKCSVKESSIHQRPTKLQLFPEYMLKLSSDDVEDVARPGRRVNG